MKITERNCKQKLFDYMEENYDEDFVVRQFRKYPYQRYMLSEAHLTKDMIEWFLLEWKNPNTGKTVLREFTEKFDMSPEIKDKMLQMEKLRFGRFKILENNGSRIKVSDESGNEYIITIQKRKSFVYNPGKIVVGRLHPWGDISRFAGIVSVFENEEALIKSDVAPVLELLMKEKDKIEAKVIKSRKRKRSPRK